MRPSLDSLVFLTSNAGKAREAAAFLGRPVTARALEIPEIQSLDFAAVVTAKALAAVAELGVPVLVEDSGLSLPAWKGYPGPLTKYAVGAVGEAGFARLAHAWGDPRAEAVSNLGLAWPGASPADVVVAEGRVAGTLAPERPRRERFRLGRDLHSRGRDEDVRRDDGRGEERALAPGEGVRGARGSPRSGRVAVTSDGAGIGVRSVFRESARGRGRRRRGSRPRPVPSTPDARRVRLPSRAVPRRTRR